MLNLLRELHAARQRRLDLRMFHRRKPTLGQWLQALLVAAVVFIIIFVRWHDDHFDLDKPDERPFLLLICVWVGWAVTFRRALAYRRGWLDGRANLRSSMYEATLRDMTPEEWMNAELDRDARALGYDTFETYVRTDDT